MQRRHIDAISGLRALAVLAVVLFHVDPAWLPGGFVGVDMFFVISGFVVAHSIAGAQFASFRAFLGHFYVRRFRRIMPAANAYIVTALVAGMLFIPLSASTKSFEYAGISAVVALSNVFLYLKSGDYFSEGSDLNPFTHTWSLAVEEQYYLLFPLFGYVILAGGDRHRRLRRAAIALLAGACVLSLSAAAWLTPRAPSFAFYLLPTRFWELGLGFLLRLWLTPERTRQLAVGLGRAGSAAGAVGIVLLFVAFAVTPETGFPFPGAILPCFATALLLMVTWSQPGSIVDRVLSARGLMFFGTISYSLYLWHWGVLVLMRWTTGVTTPGQKLLGLAISILLGWLSWRVVERAFHNNQARGVAPSPRFFARYGTVAALICCTAIAASLLKPAVGLAKSDQVALWDPYRRPPLPRDCPTEREAARLAGGEAIRFAARCATRNLPRLLVMGDSHAGAYQRALWRMASEGRVEPFLLTLGGCRAIYITKTPAVPGCDRFRSQAMARLRVLARPGDVILLTGLQTTRFAAGASRPIDGQAVAESRKRVRALVATGAAVVVEGPKPVLPVPLYRCVDWFNRGNPVCQEGRGIDDAAIYRRMIVNEPALRRLTDGIPGARTWLPGNVLCGVGRCSAWWNGRPLYYDTDHLSAAANDLLLPHLTALVTAPAAAPGRRLATERAAP